MLADTDVVSFLFRGDKRAEPYRPLLAGKLVGLSFMTLAELEQWALIRNWGADRRARLHRHLQRYVVFPFDVALCRWWAEVSVEARRNGRPIQTADAWIAATARLYDVALVTNNPSDYVGVASLTVRSAQPSPS